MVMYANRIDYTPLVGWVVNTIGNKMAENYEASFSITRPEYEAAGDQYNFRFLVPPIANISGDPYLPQTVDYNSTQPLAAGLLKVTSIVKPLITKASRISEEVTGMREFIDSLLEVEETRTSTIDAKDWITSAISTQLLTGFESNLINELESTTYKADETVTNMTWTEVEKKIISVLGDVVQEEVATLVVSKDAWADMRNGGFGDIWKMTSPEGAAYLIQALGCNINNIFLTNVLSGKIVYYVPRNSLKSVLTQFYTRGPSDEIVNTRQSLIIGCKYASCVTPFTSPRIVRISVT